MSQHKPTYKEITSVFHQYTPEGKAPFLPVEFYEQVFRINGIDFDLKNVIQNRELLFNWINIFFDPSINISINTDKILHDRVNKNKTPLKLGYISDHIELLIKSKDLSEFVKNFNKSYLQEDKDKELTTDELKAALHSGKVEKPAKSDFDNVLSAMMAVPMTPKKKRKA